MNSSELNRKNLLSLAADPQMDRIQTVRRQSPAALLLDFFLCSIALYCCVPMCCKRRRLCACDRCRSLRSESALERQ